MNFNYLPRKREESEIFKKEVEVWYRAGLLKLGGGGGLSLLLFDFFKVYHFYI